MFRILSKAYPRLAIACLLLSATATASMGAEPRYVDRWVYCANNLLVDKNVDEVISLIERSGKAGYTGMVLADFKFSILDRMPERYFKNAERVRKAAAAAKMEIIPTVFPIGYSDGLFMHDPNLGEGPQVKDAPFVVKGKQILPVSTPPPLPNGGFEQTKGDRFVGFRFQDDPGVASFADKTEHHGGAVSCRMQDTPNNCRLMNTVKVRPYTCYRYSCWVKTKNLKPCGFKLMASSADKTGRALTFHEVHLKENSDWTRYETAFNTFDATEVNLYVGVWGPLKGTIWFDDLALDEMSLVNVLRREACPLVVSSADGKTIYEEGKDFQPIRDPLMFNRSTTSFDFNHAGPAVRLTENSRLKDGDKLLLSWYHVLLVHDNQAACSLTDPKVFQLLKDEAKRVNDLFHPKTFFMSHDEIRVAGYDNLSEGKTPGQLLADNVKQCIKILKDVSPEARVAVWSDMFDPFHNAVDKFYLVNGSLKGSWEGLSSDIVIANWNGRKPAESLKFFADRGNPQVIAGYYDGNDLKNFEKWDEAAKGMPKVQGFMYTTWQKKYGLLEEYGKAMAK